MKWILLAVVVIAFILALAFSSNAQDRLFTPPGAIDPVVMEAFRAMPAPSRAAFGEGLILRWEGKTAVHMVRSGVLRTETCGMPLGCIEWTDGICVLHMETELPPAVQEALLVRLYADCGITQ
jgi:hypothetical protein